MPSFLSGHAQYSHRYSGICPLTYTKQLTQNIGSAQNFSALSASTPLGRLHTRVLTDDVGEGGSMTFVVLLNPLH